MANNKKQSPAASNTISVMDYNEAEYREKASTTIEECVNYKDHPTVTWINVDNVPPAHFLGELGLGFDLHPVILEDILNLNQRPKVEFLDEYVYVVLKMLYLDEKGKSVKSEQVSLVISNKFLISFQQGIQGDVFDRVRNGIRKNGTRTRRSGTDYLGYKLIDAIVENYFFILENYSDRIEAMEEEVIKTPTPKTLRSIYNLKRDLLDLRKCVWPLREVLGSLARGENSLIKRGTKIYLRDLYEQTIQIIDTIESYRDILASMLDIYLSSVSHKLNSVMKVLTIITTIFMPLTFLTGIYGMNFHHMPGLDSPYGFPVMMLAMGSVFVAMLLFFRGKKWL